MAYRCICISTCHLYSSAVIYGVIVPSEIMRINFRFEDWNDVVLIDANYLFTDAFIINLIFPQGCNKYS